MQRQGSSWQCCLPEARILPLALTLRLFMLQLAAAFNRVQQLQLLPQWVRESLHPFKCCRRGLHWRRHCQLEPTYFCC